MKISVTLLVLNLLLHVFLVESDHTLLELLEICDVVETLEDVVFELFLVGFLFLKLLTKVRNLVG
jgi:hypothetical protein